MNACEQLSDLMPAVAAGERAWSEAEQQHLRACDDCRSEWRVVRAAGRLGAGLPAASPGRVSRAVLARLRLAAAVDRRRRVLTRVGGLAGLVAAAGVALTLLVRAPMDSRTARGDAIPLAFELRLAELESASDEELAAVLAEFEPAISDGGGAAVPGVEILDDVDMERALSAWEEG